MKVLTAGGGSGGHVIPVGAIIEEIKHLEPTAEIRFWCDRSFLTQSRTVMSAIDPKIRVDMVISGKFRRYHKLAWWRQLLRFRTMVGPNIVDAFKVAAGVVQAIIKLIAWRPDVLFAKGGYVCLPIGLAARLLRVPIVIHDSDTLPGLTNRLLSRHARAIATGAPLENYSYPASKSHYVGIPVLATFRPFNNDERIAARRRLGLASDLNRPLIAVTGGGLGAKRINQAVLAIAAEVNKFADVCLISGKSQYQSLKKPAESFGQALKLFDFVDTSTMADILGAADLVVARAGATTIAELAAMAKPTILIPNIFLTAGHQLKNAEIYKDYGAVEVVDELIMEEQPEVLANLLQELLSDRPRMAKLSHRFSEFAKPEAALDVAKLVLSSQK